MLRIETFERRWQEAASPEASAALHGLLRRFYEAYGQPRVDLAALKRSVVDLLRFVTSPAGRNEANCSTVDAFVCLLTAERDDLLDRLPGDFQQVIDELGMNLNETFHNPELAERFEATPEMLLERARALGGASH